MLLNDIYFDALGVRLGRSLDLAEAVADGRYAESEYVANALTAVTVSDDVFAPDLAIAAVEDAMQRGSVDAGQVRMLLHASTYFQGQDVWTPSSYIQQETVGGHAPAIEVDQKSNGGLAALALGASYLSGCPDDAALLITTGERFCLPGFDRFRTESGTVMADGGTALVLSRTPGFARVLSCTLSSEPSLEGMYRGRRLKDAPASGTKPLDMRGRKAAFMRKNLSDLESVSARIASGICTCIADALAEAKTEVGDVRRFVVPNNGQTVRWWGLLAEMGVGLDRTTWEFGRRIGHLGSGDQVAALEHLLRTGELAPGDRVVLAGTGYGFNWGAAVVEVLDVPHWAR